MSRLKSCLFGECPSTSNCHQICYTIFRVFIGVSMAFGHGLGKLKSPEKFLENVTGMDLPVPLLFGWAAILSEFLGGILIALGLLTRPAAFFLGVTMAIAAFKVHMEHPLWGPAPSKEMALLYLASCLAFLGAGSGKFGLDPLFRGK